MPSHTQRTVDFNSTVGALQGGDAQRPNFSSHDSATLAAIFPASPILRSTNPLSPTERKNYYQANVLDSTDGDGGHTFGDGFDRNFGTSTSTPAARKAPNMAEVDLEGLKLPSPYVPNPTSPGPGSMSDSDKPNPPAGFGTTPTQNFGTGAGSQLSPHAGAARIAGATLGAYISGRSSSDSDT